MIRSMNKAFYTKLLAVYLSAALLAITTFSGPVEAMHIPVSLEQEKTTVTNRDADIAKIQKALETKIIQQKLIDLGLTPEEVVARLNNLSTEQIHELASRTDALQAGGDAGTLIYAFIILGAIYYAGLLLGAIIKIADLVGNKSSKTELSYKTDDLNQDFVKEFKASHEYFYKFDSRYSVDYMVSIVRIHVFSSDADNTGDVLLSLGLMGKEKSFDCNVFFSKLTAEEKQLVDSKMQNHPFICRSPNYTSENVLDSFPKTLPGQINNYISVNGHWAWFSATGDTEPLRRLLDNYLYNPQTCVDCIRWSYPYNARQNADVRNYLLTYMSDKTDSDKQKLLTLLPK